MSSDSTVNEVSELLGSLREHAQYLGELVIHLDPVALVAMFDAKALLLFFQIGEDFVDTAARALAAEVAQDVLTGKLKGGVGQQTRVQAG